MNCGPIFGGALALVFACGTALADPPCKLSQIASLPMVGAPDGPVEVMVGINGTPQRMLVDAADDHSVLLKDFADKAQIPQKTINEHTQIYTIGGKAEKFGAVTSLTLGSAVSNNIAMVIAPGPVDDPEIAGSIGTDILANFDVEFDFAARKVNLFASCPGIGAYWAQHYAELPVELEKLGRPTATFALDNQPLTVSFSTTSKGSAMPFNVAKARFGLDQKSPGVDSDGSSRSGDPVYKYRFKLLMAEGVAIANPLVRLYGDPDALPCNGSKQFEPSTYAPGKLRHVRCTSAGDLSLGLRELTKLHLYFAFKDRKLYFTGAADR